MHMVQLQAFVSIRTIILTLVDAVAVAVVVVGGLVGAALHVAAGGEKHCQAMHGDFQGPPKPPKTGKITFQPAMFYPRMASVWGTRCSHPFFCSSCGETLMAELLEGSVGSPNRMPA